MNQATIIMLNMRGGCATVGDKVHTLFRLNSRRAQPAQPVAPADGDVRELSTNPG
jgi:hypothetical protein